MPQYATHGDILRSITAYPWIRHFRHLLPIRKPKASRVENLPQYRNIVKPSLRIKYWNILPGDQVRILGDRKSTIYDVIAISRLRNRVWVSPKGQPENNKNETHKNFHYSRCQLYLGEYQFPPSTNFPESRTLPVFAQRLGTSPPLWSKELGRWSWTRFATKTRPTIPDWFRGQRIAIPWPEFTPPKPPPPTAYDTLPEHVSEVTYKPPPFAATVDGIISKPPTEQEYIFSLYNPHRESLFANAQPPAELYLTKELSNPHSRVKKLARWKNFLARNKALLKEFIAAELKSLNGRNVREATADARWKWREQLATEEKERRREQWLARGGEQRLQKKEARKARKEAKRIKRLTELTLLHEPHQIVPKDVSV